MQEKFRPKGRQLLCNGSFQDFYCHFAGGAKLLGQVYVSLIVPFYFPRVRSMHSFEHYFSLKRQQNIRYNQDFLVSSDQTTRGMARIRRFSSLDCRFDERFSVFD